MKSLEFSFTKNFVFGIIVIVFIFSLFEIVLHVYGFQYSQFPREIQQKNIEWWMASENRSFTFVTHNDRMWALSSDDSRVNEYGYQGEKVPIKRSAGVKRILFLGDSCTNSGPDHYPEKTISKLQNNFGIKAEAIISGTPGYSTYQGLKWLPEFLEHKPDVLVVYFGWNDHWYAWGGGPDNEFAALSQANIFIGSIFRNIRTYQLLHYLIHPPQLYSPRGREITLAQGINEFLKTVRVPPEDYISNIQQIADFALRNNIEVYFIDAPYSKHIDQQDNVLVPPGLRPHVSSIHQVYDFLLRGIVKEYDGVHLITFDDVQFDRSLMMEDGIHPTGKGYDVIASRLVNSMRETSTSLFSELTSSIADNTYASQN
jgi:lysophospholipase L1-like esterase